MRPAARIRRRRGFTTTEMMVVVAIVAILAALAAPSLGDMVRAQRIKTAAFDTFASLNFARSEAIKRNQNVTLVPAGTWAGGWTITDANGTVLREQSGWEQVTASGPATIVFRGTGRLSSAVSPIHLTATAGGQVLNRCVRIDLSGRANVQESAC